MSRSFKYGGESGDFQAQTQGTTLAKNICFNGPRAGFNFNDGMGGGDVLAQNLVFNMVRETQVISGHVWRCGRALPGANVAALGGGGGGVRTGELH